MITPPARKISCRLTVTLCGLRRRERAARRALQARHGAARGRPQPARWRRHAVRVAHRADRALADRNVARGMRRSLRPNAYARMICNEFVSAESPVRRHGQLGSHACSRPDAKLERLPIWVGVDARPSATSTALVAVTFDKKSSCVRLVPHRVFTPTPGDPIDFEATVEATLLIGAQRYVLRQVLFDPFQMAAVSQRLVKAHVPIEEFPQTRPELDGGHAATCST